MVHMTCKRTKNAKEDLAYVVNKFLRAEPLYSTNAVRNLSDSHTQTVSPDKRHLQVIKKFIHIYTYVCVLFTY